MVYERLFFMIAGGQELASFAGAGTNRRISLEIDREERLTIALAEAL